MKWILSYSFREVDGIHLSHLTNFLHGEFHHDVLAKAKATPAIVANMARELAAYEAALEKETQASFKELTDSITEEIYKTLVPTRNGFETAFKAALRAQMAADDQTVVDASTALFNLAHLHKLHTEMKVDAQTDAIRDYIADVEANHMAELELTGYTSLFNKLKAANDAVCDKMAERTELESQRKPNGQMERAREATDVAYYEFVHALESFSYVQGRATYEGFIDYLNALIARYNRMYLNTTQKPSTGEETTEEVEEEVEEEETTKPEGGSGSDTNTEEEETYRVTYKYHDGTEEDQEYKAGQTIVPPTNTLNYVWKNLPATMPAHNITVTEEWDINQPPPSTGGGESGFE